MKKTVTIALALFVICFSLSAQAGLRGKSKEQGYTLTVASNVADATVYVNNKKMGGAPFSGKFNAGKYVVKVTAAGYREYVIAVSLLKDMTIKATLAPRLLTLGVNSNVNKAQIYVNNQFSGVTPAALQLKPGKYVVKVAAAGYKDYAISISLTADMKINAVLNPDLYTVRVSANVNRAELYVNNQRKGVTPATLRLKPGKYVVRVAAAGYRDYIKEIVLEKETDIDAYLELKMASVRVSIPEEYLTKEQGALNRIKIYVDGKHVNKTSFELSPGQHTIRIVSGAFKIEGIYSFEPGEIYILEPVLSLRLR